MFYKIQNYKASVLDQWKTRNNGNLNTNNFTTKSMFKLHVFQTYRFYQWYKKNRITKGTPMNIHATIIKKCNFPPRNIHFKID